MTDDEISIWKRFFFPRDQVHRHWYSALDNFQFASTDFYKLIEAQLEARKVPGLEISRVELSEGGILSDKREYLRLKRERLVFDICAAPFGTSYFFSFRFVELALRIEAVDLLVLFISLSVMFGFSIYLFGFFWGTLALLFALGTCVYVMRNALVLGLKDLDATLLKTPVIGAIYEIFFRKETYYREDTRQMYLSTVNTITEMVVDEVTAAKGVKVVKRYDRKPTHGSIYDERTTHRDESKREA